MVDFLRNYYSKKKEKTEQGLIKAGLVKCNKCQHWIGKDFSDKNNNCIENCITL